MVQQQIVQYIKDSLKKGYNLDQIKGNLLSGGWNPFQVDEAIRFTIEPKKAKKTKIWAISFFILSILIGAFLLVSLYSKPQDKANPTPQIQNISFSIAVTTKRIQAGGELAFTNNLGQQGLEGYAVYPIYKINRGSSGESIVTWKSPSGVKNNDVVKYDLSKTISPGSYNLTAVANFRGKDYSASDDFYVFEEAEEPTCDDGIKNQGEESVDCGGPCKPCDFCSDGIMDNGEKGVDCGGSCEPCQKCKTCNDFNACTKDTCDNGICKNEMIHPCCGNFICETQENESNCPADCLKESDKPVSLMTKTEIMNQAKVLSKTDEEKAGDFCDSVDDDDMRDECLRVVAYNTNKEIYCNYIISSVKKDACYMEFAYKGNHDVCSLIKSEYLRKSCEGLF